LYKSNEHCNSLRRRFEQNQEDCTFTVLAILPTATENILDAIPVEQVLDELQRQKAQRLARSVGPSEIGTSAPPSVVDTTEDDARSESVRTESYVHASQIATEGESSSGGGVDAGEEKKSKKTKAELWNEMKISCKYHLLYLENGSMLTSLSNNPRLHPPLYTLPPYPPHAHPTQLARSPQLPCLCSFACNTAI
jgi:hypothetical protein